MAGRWARLGVILLFAAAAATIPATPAFGWTYAVDHFVGGLNWPADIYGSEVNIETQDPTVKYSNLFSCAWNMITITTNQSSGGFQGYPEYMQVGWMKTFGNSPRYFTEFDPDGTSFSRTFYGAPSVGSVHDYKITSDSSYFYLMIDGSNKLKLLRGPAGDIPWAPGNTYEFEGEVVNANSYLPGTTANHVSFTSGTYKKLNGSWYKAYYHNNYSTSPAGGSTAGDSSTSFSVWDKRK